MSIRKIEINQDPYIKREGLKVKRSFINFVEKEVLPGLDIESEKLWYGFCALVEKYTDINRALLKKREYFQNEINQWHLRNGTVTKKPEIYHNFLRKIGYIVEEPEDFVISTTGLDPEITEISGPQLVVPISNARYALNAANARWGSLYDAIYGTDIISREGDLAPGKVYNPQRGQQVFVHVAKFMDKIFPLQNGTHKNVNSYMIIRSNQKNELEILQGGTKTALKDVSAFAGFRQEGETLIILLIHNRLHMELVINHTHPIGKTHPAGLADVIMESAVTVIQDCEDSVVAVDVSDKIAVYRNWLGLMQGTLEEQFEKNKQQLTRILEPDRVYEAGDGTTFSLKGRALMMVRNVGHLMTSDIVLDNHDRPVGEGLIDGVITTLCALHDRKKKKNSRTCAIYIVKPKMHGPEEAAFTTDFFGDIETLLNLPTNTIKLGIMDEERRTSANLKAVIRQVEKRIFFINTGFLDRTGDEIHTAMAAGPVLSKEKIKLADWLTAYEDRNVLIGLQCGFVGRAQIGKGMWAQPDSMQDMMEKKIIHPRAGANCAWVPSPTAATLHALHYHYINVLKAQEERKDEKIPSLNALFSMPVLNKRNLSEKEKKDELNNNAQGILGYVVRWVNHGIGCSKVWNIHNVALMEDRATCRISSQAIANWLKHDIITEEDVYESFKNMASVVDEQNKGDKNYKPMAIDVKKSEAFVAAITLVLRGAEEPSGYTEPILHAARRKVKNSFFQVSN